MLKNFLNVVNLLLLTLMMKVLLLLNVNNTVLALLLVKKEVKRGQASYHRSKRRSKWVKNLNLT